MTPNNKTNEKIFNDTAMVYMDQFNLDEFKSSHPTLYATIMMSMLSAMVKGIEITTEDGEEEKEPLPAAVHIPCDDKEPRGDI